MKRVIDITLDLKVKRYDEVLMKQMDTTVLNISLLDNSRSIALSNLLTADCIFTKPNGSIVIQNAEVDTVNNRVIVNLNENCLRAYGKAKIEIELKKDNEVVSTFQFDARIEKTSKNNIEAVNTPNYIEQLETEVAQAQANARTVIEETTEEILSQVVAEEVATALAGKVDKETGKALISTTDLAQIGTNTTNIATLDTNKANKTYVDTELAKKVDKETGKSLVLNTDIAQITTNKNNITALQTNKANSTDVYTKAQADTLLGAKVDKVTGKGLSTEDYTTTEKTKLNGIEAGATNTVIDSALSSSSTNPVQNKKVYEALSNKVDKVSGKGLSTNDFTNAYKTKLDGLENYDDTEITEDIAEIQEEQTEQNEYIAELEAENESLKEDIAGLTKTKEEIGERIDITDSAEMRFAKFEVSGNSKQNTTEGKNIFNCKGINVVNDGGISVVGSEDGTLKIKGTCTSTVWPNITRWVKEFNYDLGNEYIMTDNLDSHDNIIISLETSNVTISSNGVSKVISQVPSNAYVRVSPGTYDITLKPMLRLASITDDTYEPYTNGASPNPDYPQEIHSVGDNVNLFDKDNITRINGTIRAENNNFEGGGNNYAIAISCLPNTTYTVQKRNDGNNNRFALASSEAIPSETATVVTPLLNRIKDDNNSVLTLTTGATAQFLVIQYYRYGETILTEQEILDSIKIEKGTKATGYSPYGQGSASVTVGNKNLFDKDNANVLMAYFSENKNIGGSSSTKTLYVPVDSNTTYTVSKIKSAKFRILTTDEIPAINVTGIDYMRQDTGTSLTITTSQNAKYLCIYYYHQIDDNITEQEILDSIKIEKGTAPTTYTPHEHQTYVIPTQQPMRKIGDYADTFVKENGQWYEKHLIGEVVLDGSETTFKIRKNKTNTTYFEYPNAIFEETDVLTLPKGLCNFLLPNTGNILFTTDTIGFTFTPEGNLRFNLLNTVASTIAELQTWLSINNLEVIGLLNEPLFLPCTQEQTAVLEEIRKKAKSYKGGTHIYSTDEVSPIFDVEYRVDKLAELETRIEQLESEVNA